MDDPRPCAAMQGVPGALAGWLRQSFAPSDGVSSSLTRAGNSSGRTFRPDDDDRVEVPLGDNLREAALQAVVAARLKEAEDRGAGPGRWWRCLRFSGGAARSKVDATGRVIPADGSTLRRGQPCALQEFGGMLNVYLWVVGLTGFSAGVGSAEEPLLTVAEKSGFQATARYDEVVDLCRRIDASSPHAAMIEMGRTVEGRSIPVLVLANPPVTTPEEARRGGKLVVLAFGNIHAGEVCGKEALPMLAREILSSPNPALLERLVILFAPIFNCDGNERVSKDNRPGQNGPAEGMGVRHNAQDLDLNRDFVKLESPEVQALVRFMTAWDPAIVIDTHTTDGTPHQYTMTYEGPRHAAGDPRVIAYVRERMLPDVTRRLEATSGYRSFFYGNLHDGGATWSTDYADTPRFSTNYIGLRNRLAVLAEAYAYASFKDRVLCTRDFVKLILEHAASDATKIRELLSEVDRETVARGREPRPEDRVAVRTREEEYDGPVRIAGYVEMDEPGRSGPTETKRDYEARHVGRSVPTESVARAFAYAFPASLANVKEKLQQHGIAVEELREDREMSVEVYRVEDVRRADRPFMKHVTVNEVSVTVREEKRRLPAGTILVRTAQPLGTLASYLLEPQSADGLVTWNFLDDDLIVGRDFPVLRLTSPVVVESGPAAGLPQDRGGPREVTFADVLAGREPQLRGSAAAPQGWLEDGEHYLQVRENRLHKVNAASGESAPFHDPQKMAAGLMKIEGFTEDKAKNLAEATRFTMDAARRGALWNRDGDLYYATFDGEFAARLTKTPDRREELADFSPDGRQVSFVSGQNLFVVDVATQTERQLTTDGGGLIYNGKADWVYYEELFNRSERAYWWSKDSAAICFLRLDDGPVNTFTLVDHEPVRQRIEETRYPKAGDPNPLVQFGVVAVDGKTAPVFAELRTYDPVQIIISGAGFFPGAGAPAYFYVQNREQTWLDFCMLPRTGGEPKVLFRDQTQAWIESPGEPKFLADGSFLLSSERTGWKHWYLYSADGTLKHPVTTGEWEARGLECVDEAGGWIYVTGTRDSHIAENLYRARLDGSAIERLTQASGHHNVSVSPKGNLYVDTWSSHAAPPQVGLYRTDGTLVRMLDTNPVRELEEVRRSPVELFQITMSDGFKIEAAMIKPTNFDPTKKYPVWFQTYAGPHAPTIRDAWGNGYTHEQGQANEGFIIFKADPRSASGKGAVSAWTAYKRLGVPEMRDIEEVITWVRSQPYVDPDRIGMSGYSYGGFMTAYCLTHSKLFRCGIAGGPVTDWGLYDTIYTERYMNTPQNNPSGYAETSVIAAAANLHGRLLLIHGTLDDNVHMQNTIKLADALIKANKDFEIMLYPGFRHGIWGEHYNRLTMGFMKRNLLAPEPAPIVSPASGSGEAAVGAGTP